MKTRIYIVLASLIGLLAGYVLFGRTSEAKLETKAHSHSKESTQQMWTCSMHPQIMQPEPGDCPICGMDLIPAEAGADGLAPDQFKLTENALALADIQTSIVGNKDDSNDNVIALSGKIAVNEEAIAVQASYFNGRIDRLNVNYEGQEIRKGQLLATIYSPELVAAQQELLTTASLKESQPQLYKAVRNKLKLWKLSEEQISGIENSGTVRKNFPVYATVSGTVSEMMSAEGDYVKKGQPIAKVNNLNTVWAEFDAYESEVSQFKKGQKINIVANAYPNEKFNATISFIDPILNTQTRTVTVRAILENSQDLFKPGMFVTGSIETISAINKVSKLMIPSTAVMWTGERSLVYVKVNPNEPIFEMREVILGARKDESIEVLSGLDLGEEIVTHGTFTVDAAAQLQGKKSMMNKMDGKPKNDSETAMMKMEFPKAFQEDFKTVLPDYFKLKDAFVASDSQETSESALHLFDIFKELDVTNLNTMEKSHINKSIEFLNTIASSKDLEKQRQAFVFLNENMVAITSNIDDLVDTIYVQKCPMANNDKGAIWLSEEEDIRNPYFGDAMLKCGSVIETYE